MVGESKDVLRGAHHVLPIRLALLPLQKDRSHHHNGGGGGGYVGDGGYALVDNSKVRCVCRPSGKSM